MSLKSDTNWNIDKPFNFNKARLAKVRGNVSRNFPPIANNIAKTNSPTMIINLKPLDIFLDEILLIIFKRK